MVVEAGETEPSFVLLGDDPYRAADDPLRFDQVAEDLAQLLIRSAAATPLTLGVEGDWGMGKSSLMRRIEAHLQRGKVRTVWFNAWAVGTGSGREGLVKTVLDQLDRGFLRRALRNRNVMTGLRLAVTIAASWLRLGVLVDTVWREFGLDPHARNELSQLIEDTMKRWLERQQKTWPNIPERQIIAVFVDDLDRCAPAAVLEILEAVRLYLGTQGFVFVLGYDRNVVSRSILRSQHYDAGMTVRSYLEKIVQISYRIEPPGDREADRLIAQYLSSSGTADLFQDADCRVILEQNDRNPRRVKRFINAVVLQYPLDEVWKELGAASMVTALILQYYWPEFVQLLIKRPDADVVAEFLQYVDARQAITGRASPDSPEWQIVVKEFQASGLGVPSAIESRESRAALVQELDEARSAYRELPEKDDLVPIVRGLAATDSRELLAQLRRRPLPAPPGEVVPPERGRPTVARQRGVARVELPAPSGPAPYRLDLGAVLPPAEVEAIGRRGSIVFHTTGSVGGVQNPAPQRAVAAAMTAELGTVDPSPSFLYLLGDVVYFQGQTSGYYAQFYEPYSPYARPIFAIAGNHDAGTEEPATEAPLTGFVRNFCAPPGTHTPESGDNARLAMTQPNVYWTLRAPFVTIIGLFTNVPEGGSVDDEQAAWLVSELRDAPAERAVIVAMHHPVYSLDVNRSGSASMRAMLDAAAASAGRTPDLVLSGHVMNYQRFSRYSGGRTTAYVMAGAGGYRNIRRMARIDGQPPTLPFDLSDGDATLLAYEDTGHGYLRVEVSAESLEGTYMAFDKGSAPGPRAVDHFTIARSVRSQPAGIQ